MALRRSDPNVEMLLLAVKALEPLLDQIAFVGGCATGLLITDPAAPPVRVTTDVDAIVQIASYTAFLKLEEELQNLGLTRCHEQGAPICRWQKHNVKIDVMPTEPTVLGFSNKWYGAAIQDSVHVKVRESVFRLITAPYFLATKLEAFFGRGRGDFRSSHDLEDIITVVDGRSELIREVANCSADLRLYLSEQFASMLKNPDFTDSIPGHLLPDAASQGRIGLILTRLRSIAIMESDHGV